MRKDRNPVTMTDAERAMVNKMNSENLRIFIGVGGLFWLGKTLMDGLTCEECETLDGLERKGIVKLETKTLYI
jgi:hypothetical protein